MNVLDLFSGIGGFSLGLERAGFKTLAFCEIDPFCQKVLRKHWENVYIYDDVKKITAKDVKFKVDLICGGFPCQDISTAGLKRGLDGERSGLWFEFKRLIEEIQPKYAIIENVANLRSKGLNRILKDLWAIGYDSQWHILSASSFGYFHQRERLFIIAYSKRIGSQRQRSLRITFNQEKSKNRKTSRLIDAFQRDAMPYVCREHDGASSKLDKNRLKALGNAIIPDIAEFLGKSIMEFENEGDNFATCIN